MDILGGWGGWGVVVLLGTGDMLAIVLEVTCRRVALSF